MYQETDAKVTNGGSAPNPPEGTVDPSVATQRQATAHEGTLSPPAKQNTANKVSKKTSKKTRPKKATGKICPDKEFMITSIAVHDSGRPMLTYQLCLQKLGIKYRDHAFIGVQVDRGDGKGFVNNTAGMGSSIYQQVLENIYIKTPNGVEFANFPKYVRDEAIDALVFKNKHNPLVDWLQRLKPVCREEQDGAIDLLKKLYKLNVPEEVASKFTDEEIERYYSDVLLLIAKGIVYRWLHDGKSFPFFPVLKGGEGIGKSLFISLLLPPEIAQQGAFVDTFDMGQAKKEKELILRSAALVECAEMAGYTRKDIAEHKALISSTMTKVRVAYEKFPEQILRKAIMFGTSNDEECFSVDPHRQRRHLPLPVALHDDWTYEEVEKKLPAIMEQYRDLLFGHAKFELEQGRGCSYEHWAPTSLQIRDMLVKSSEKQPITFDLAIDELLVNKVDQKGGHHVCLTEDQLKTGLPLTVPAACHDVMSLQKMIANNTARLPGFPRNPTAEYIADRLQRKGWTKLARQRPDSMFSKNKQTFYRPPDGSIIERRAVFSLLGEDPANEKARDREDSEEQRQIDRELNDLHERQLRDKMQEIDDELRSNGEIPFD